MTKFGGSCLLLCLMAMAGVLLGCSSGSRPNADSPEAYAAVYCRAWSDHATLFRVKQELAGLGLNPSQHSKELALQVASQESALAGDLANIEAPAEIAELHAEIVEAHRQAAQAWTGVEQALDPASGEPKDGSPASVEDAFSAVTRATDSEPTLPDEYQQAIRQDEQCKKLAEAFSGSDG